jgi:iron complex outermembrane recepter protein
MPVQNPKKMKTTRRISGPRASTYRGLLLSAVTCFSSIAAVASASAQVTSAATDGSSKAAISGTDLAEIIVTAQKRGERLQDVPVAVSVITPSEAAAAGVTSTSDIAFLVPGLTYTRTANVGSPYLRGVGSNQVDPSSESSVSMYVDDVYIPAPQANLFSLDNIEQIEVLKGPQGTLFGRNATGGVIQIRTRDPQQEPMAETNLTYANYNDVRASVYGTAGVTKNIAADLYASYENQGTGWGKNLTTGHATYIQAENNYDLRSKWLIDIDDRTNVRLEADYSHSVSVNPLQKPQDTLSPINGTTYPGRYNTLNDNSDLDTVNTGGASIRVERDLAWAGVSSITAYRDTLVKYELDNDITSLAIADADLTEHASDFSEELQLSSPKSSAIKWIMGAFYFNGRGSLQPLTLNGAVAIPLDEQHTTSVAGYGQTTVPLGFNSNGTVGLRYTTENQTYTLPAASLRDSQRFEKLTYRAALDHHFTENIMMYVSQNQGFKSGGFNLLAPGDAYKPETLEATEVGLKSTFLDKRVTLNVASFYYDYKNIQLSLPEPQSSIITNAARARIEGGEVDLDVRPSSDLLISGGASFQHGRFVDYPGAVAVSADGEEAPAANFTGRSTPRTTPFSGNLSAQYTFPTDAGNFVPALSASYDGGFYWEPDNRLRQPAYTLLNASLAWSPPSKQFTLRLWIKNMFDRQYYAQRVEIPSAGDGQIEAPPRTFGVTASARF